MRVQVVVSYAPDSLCYTLAPKGDELYVYRGILGIYDRTAVCSRQAVDARKTVEHGQHTGGAHAASHRGAASGSAVQRPVGGPAARRSVAAGGPLLHGARVVFQQDVAAVLGGGLLDVHGLRERAA